MINKEIVKKVSEIARLKLSDEEIEKFAKELEEIEKAFSKMQEVNTENVEPAFHPIEIKNVWREDIPKPSFSQEEALSNTEHKENGYFKGPKII
ncbi:MAG TPA: Asp-tRNA(Asn)/Glu-tRNA(Gln) amidotransferase subunit GatC [Nanoarchaeota archaeon]|nr:Asp-tRNA(Asn)/Glu-tRNA(Gln) amidotransferase subunit GatC [Nanoarchaeota archaeon]